MPPGPYFYRWASGTTSFLFFLSRSFRGFCARGGDSGVQACPQESGLGAGDMGIEQLRAQLSSHALLVVVFPLPINCCLKRPRSFLSQPGLGLD